MKDYGIDVVDSVEELRLIDDENMSHGRCTLVDDPRFGWFLLFRDADAPDDGKSVVITKSGRGRWCMMTPATSAIVVPAMEAAALKGHPRLHELVK